METEIEIYGNYEIDLYKGIIPLVPRIKTNKQRRNIIGDETRHSPTED